MSVSASIPDTSLGLTSSEIQILRQQQQLVLQGGHTGGGVTRGRGTGRTSNASSRAASAASSHGRLLLDPMSLRALSHQLDNLQEQIRNRLDYVCSFFFPSCQDSYHCFTSGLIPTPTSRHRIKGVMDRQFCGAFHLLHASHTPHIRHDVRFIKL